MVSRRRAAFGGLHRLHQLRDDGGAFPAQERARLVEPCPVVRSRNLTFARRGAEADDVRMAVAMRLLVRRERVAAAQAVVLLHEILRGAHDGGGRKRTEVERAVVAHDATRGEARERVVGIRTQREVALVVAHEDVEVRLVLLDQRSLREQRLGLVPHAHPFKVGDGVHHRANLRREVCAWTEIGKHASAQVLRLADVDDDAPAVPHQVTARAQRNALQAFSQDVVHALVWFLLLLKSLGLRLFFPEQGLAFRRTLLELAFSLAQRTRKFRELLASEHEHQHNYNQQNLPWTPGHLFILSFFASSLPNLRAQVKPHALYNQ